MQSVRAIETPGGDDDRKWLSFWVIFFVFSCVERFTAVLLSRVPVKSTYSFQVNLYVASLDVNLRHAKMT